MAFTQDTAREAGRKGGLACLAAHGREHMARIGRLGFLGLARKLGYAGGSRRGALIELQQSGRLARRGPDPTEAIRWAESVLSDLDPSDPKVPY
jgi:general stress protein YciG